MLFHPAFCPLPLQPSPRAESLYEHPPPRTPAPRWPPAEPRQLPTPLPVKRRVLGSLPEPRLLHFSFQLNARNVISRACQVTGRDVFSCRLMPLPTAMAMGRLVRSTPRRGVHHQWSRCHEHLGVPSPPAWELSGELKPTGACGVSELLARKPLDGHRQVGDAEGGSSRFRSIGRGWGRTLKSLTRAEIMPKPGESPASCVNLLWANRWWSSPSLGKHQLDE